MSTKYYNVNNILMYKFHSLDPYGCLFTFKSGTEMYRL